MTRLRGASSAAVYLFVGIGCTLAACGETAGEESTDAGSGSDSSASDTGASKDATSSSDADAEASTSDVRSDVPTESAADSASEEQAETGPGVPVFPDAGPDCGIGAAGEPLDLACTGLYSDWTSKTVAPGNAAYAPGYVFWSDGALKQRWIALPPGTQIDTSQMDGWVFPVDTRIWKEFSLVLPDAGSPTRVETRMIWKRTPTLWYRTAYRWSADGQTSATELTTGEQNVAGTTYEIPSQVECNDCHDGRPGGVLGFEAVALSAPSASGLTMAQLQAQGLITDAPSGSLAVPGDTTASATLGWLHINCGVACHNSAQGLARNTGFWMRLDVASLSSVETTDTYTTGWNHLTHNFTIPDAGKTFRFHSCDVPESAAYYRPDHRTGVNGVPSGVQMPPIVTHIVDDPAMATLAAWIDEGCDADAGDQ